MRKLALLALGLFALVNTTNIALAASTVQKVSGGYCLHSKKWVPAAKSRSTYKAMSARNKNYKGLAKKCAKLLSPSKVAFSKIPTLSSIIDGSANSSSFHVSTVSGLPPSLSDLASSDASSLYYTSGVLASILGGSPSESDCRQFYTSPVDGESGGMSACYMAQTTGESLGNILQSGTTSCYMQNFPEVAAADNSVATLVKGSLPSGGWKSLFSVPASSARTVKITPTGDSGQESVKEEENEEGGGENIFIRISSASENLSRGEQYRVNVYFCEEGSSAPQEEEQVVISSSNILSFTQKGNKGSRGQFGSLVSARLIPDGNELAFDPTAARTANTSHFLPDRGNFKANISIEDGIITTKILDVRENTRKSYSKASFTGADAPGLRFLAGAFKESFSYGGRENLNSGGVEYRDVGYRSAPSNELVSALASVDFGADSFYTSSPTAPTASTFSCRSAKASIEITLNVASAAMAGVRAECETARLDARNFCQSDSLNAVREAFFSACMPNQ